MRRAILCTFLVLAALALFGCGSGSSSTGTSTGTTAGVTAPGGQARTGNGSRHPGNATTATAAAGSSYAARADAICTRYQQQRRSLFSRLAQSYRPRQQRSNASSIRQRAAAAYREAVASARRELAEL